MSRYYIMEDSEGYPYNSEFKPDFVTNGDRYHGYKTNNQDAIFYYFAVQGYDLTFSYKGVKYYLSPPKIMLHNLTRISVRTLKCSQMLTK